jgi:hypothetical protein
MQSSKCYFAGKSTKAVSIHRVMMIVISPIPDKNQWKEWEVDHIDQVRSNNAFSNLGWVLASTNKKNYYGKYDGTKKKRSIG